MYIDNREFDRNGNLFVAIVSYDFDYGWICEEWRDGEYEVNSWPDGNCHTEDARLEAVAEGLEIAKRRGGRIHHYYESPEDIARKHARYIGQPKCRHDGCLCD